MEPVRHIPSGLLTRVRLLSLDVAAGAAGGGLMAVRFFDAEIHWMFYLILSMAVWSIYTLDHLLDAQRLRDNAHTVRHYFHFKYRNPLYFAWIIVSASCFFLAIFFLELLGVYFGLGMLVIAGLHLALVKITGDSVSPFLVKEAGVALVYSLGIWGFPLLKASGPVDLFAFVPFLEFFTLALCNLLLISLYEMKVDQLDGQTSFARAMGEKGTRTVINFLLSLVVGLIIVELIFVDFNTGEWKFQLIIFAMLFLITAILVRPGFFGKDLRYRYYADGAFLFPFFAILIS